MRGGPYPDWYEKNPAHSVAPNPTVPQFHGDWVYDPTTGQWHHTADDLGTQPSGSEPSEPPPDTTDTPTTAPGFPPLTPSEQTLANPPQMPSTRFFAGTPITAPSNFPYPSMTGWNTPPPENIPPNEPGMLPDNAPSFLPPTPENTPPFENNNFPSSFPENIPPNETGGFPTPFPVDTPPIESTGNIPINIPPNENGDYPTPVGSGPTNVPPDDTSGYPTPIPQNTPPNDFSQPPQNDSYFPSGAYNVPPDETMTPTPADLYYLPDGTGGYKVIDPNTGQPVDNIPGTPLPSPETGLPSSPMDLPTNPLSQTPTVPLIGDNPQSPAIDISPGGSPVGSLTPDAVASGLPLPGATAGLGSPGGSIETIGGKLAWHMAQPLFGGKTLAQVAKENPQLLPGLANMGLGFAPSGGWQGTNTGPGGVSHVTPQ